MVCNTCLSSKPIGDVPICTKCGIMVCEHDHRNGHRCLKARSAPARPPRKKTAAEER